MKILTVNLLFSTLVLGIIARIRELRPEVVLLPIRCCIVLLKDWPGLANRALDRTGDKHLRAG
jgi:hypothetical protein